MSNKDSKKFWVRLSCLILAGIMVVGVATTAIFMIVEGLGNHDHDDHDGHDHGAAYDQIALPEYDKGWTV